MLGGGRAEAVGGVDVDDPDSGGAGDAGAAVTLAAGAFARYLFDLGELGLACLAHQLPGGVDDLGPFPGGVRLRFAERQGGFVVPVQRGAVGVVLDVARGHHRAVRRGADDGVRRQGVEGAARRGAEGEPHPVEVLGDRQRERGVDRYRSTPRRR
ncbi:hypothetical protein GCM10009731_56890 [Streptomyces globosus]